MFHQKSAILRFGHVYDVIVTVYIACFYLCQCVWKNTHSYTDIIIRRIGEVAFKFLGKPILLNRVTEKGLVRPELNKMLESSKYIPTLVTASRGTAF